jgi:hypothetical protein
MFCRLGYSLVACATGLVLAWPDCIGTRWAGYHSCSSTALGMLQPAFPGKTLTCRHAGMVLTVGSCVVCGCACSLCLQPYSPELLREFVAYARARLTPQLTPAAETRLIESYKDLRRQCSNEKVSWRGVCQSTGLNTSCTAVHPQHMTSTSSRCRIHPCIFLDPEHARHAATD